MLPAFATGSASAVSRRWTMTGERVAKLDAIDDIMRGSMQKQSIRAGAVAAARQGEIAFERAYTWAEPDYPVTETKSPFRLASVSKAFTEALIYRLVEADLLKRDTAIFPYLDLERAALPGQSVDKRLHAITVGQVLDHKGGWDRKAADFDPCFRMRMIANKLGLTTAPTQLDIARYMVGEPLQFDPGSRESYSNFGYLVLGLVAEKAAKDSFGNALKAHALAPMGIVDAFVAHTRKDMRLPNEGFYDQPGMGLTPEFPAKKVLAPLPYGGEGWLTEAMDGAAGLAASAGAVARLAGHYAICGYGAAARRSMVPLRRNGGYQQLWSVASRRDGLLRRHQHEQHPAIGHEQRGVANRRRLRRDRVLKVSSPNRGTARSS